MARYCVYCGKPVKEKNKFCTHCGKSMLSKIPQTENKTPDVFPEIIHEKMIDKVEEITDEDGSEESIYSKSMKLTNLTIRDLITPDSKLTFLAGAGCSIDPPSCLPAGRAMMDAIIDYTCAESEIKKIKELEDLRFEQLIEILSKTLDPELKIIDFYGLCDKPNLQHFFLAEMMKQGQFVLTTNFDFLIEYALQQSGVLKEEVKVVITKEDFEEFNNPQELYFNGLKALYKVHGSTKNVVTSIPTRDSLIATIRAFGSNKEGENVFQLESFKQPAFTNLTTNRSLVVMGYSGSDDFDIIPTLKILKNLQNLIWLNYVQDDEGKESIYEINEIEITKDMDKINRILVDIKRINSTNLIYRVDANTPRLINDLIGRKLNLSQENFRITPINWIKENIESFSNSAKYHNSSMIYYDFNRYSDALRCANEALRMVKEPEELHEKAIILATIGSIYGDQTNYQKGLNYFEEALRISDQMGYLKVKSYCLNCIGGIFRDQGKYSEALEAHEKALNVVEDLGDPELKATSFSNLGNIYLKRGNYPEALKWYKKTLQINEQTGNLSTKAITLSNIGHAYYFQENYPKAQQHYIAALKIDEQLGNLKYQAYRVSSIGNVFYSQEKYSEALKWYEKALKINELVGDLRGKGIRLSNIGSIYYKQKSYYEALKRYNEALQIFTELGLLFSKEGKGMKKSIDNIAEVYIKQGNYQEALKLFKKLLQINEQIGDLSGKAANLNNIGTIHFIQKNYPKALERFEEAQKILSQLEHLESQDEQNLKLLKENIEFLKNKMK